MEITIEQAKKNLTIILESDKLELNKKTHVIADVSLKTLFETASKVGELTKENELLKVKVSELETLNAPK